MVQLTITRVDQEPLGDWRELQRIKNELVGAETEGVELFPAESRLVDATNLTIMYVLGQLIQVKVDENGQPELDDQGRQIPRLDDRGRKQPVIDKDGNPTFPMFPFGHPVRYVAEHAPFGKRQRPFRPDQKPKDLRVITEESVRQTFKVWQENQPKEEAPPAPEPEPVKLFVP